jgi:hypothetical protein
VLLPTPVNITQSTAPFISSITTGAGTLLCAASLVACPYPRFASKIGGTVVSFAFSLPNSLSSAGISYLTGQFLFFCDHYYYYYYYFWLSESAFELLSTLIFRISIKMYIY